jgi:hypothetical protein
VRVTRSPVRLGDITVANAPQAEAASQPVEAPVHARAPVAQAPAIQQQPQQAARAPVPQQKPQPVAPTKAAAPSAPAAPAAQCGIGLVLSTIAGGSVQVCSGVYCLRVQVLILPAADPPDFSRWLCSAQVCCARALEIWAFALHRRQLLLTPWVSGALAVGDFISGVDGKSTQVKPKPFHRPPAICQPFDPCRIAPASCDISSR